MATIDQRELDLKRWDIVEMNGDFRNNLFAVHASASFTVRHPDRSMLVHCLFSRLPQQILLIEYEHKVGYRAGKGHLDTLVDVGHPLLLLCCCGSEHCEGLAPDIMRLHKETD